MPEVTFTVLVNADDGSCNSGGGGFTSDKGGYLEIGNGIAVGSQQAFYRFDNVTIPATAVIDSAILKLTSYSTGGASTCSVIVHFETEDDPLAPTDDTDLLGRSIDAGVAWSSIPSWAAGVTYDSPELNTLLQSIIDRGGWNSGQAVQVHVLDNGSSANANRRPATYEHSTYNPAQLYISYSIPFKPELSDSIEISESIAIESDLVTQDNIEVSESTGLLLGFDESLPTITQDVTVAESVTMIRGLGGLPEQSESIELSESVGLLIGFDESLPTITQDITLSEYSLIDISPTISVFESITLWESGNIRPEPFTADDINLSEYVLTRRGYWADVDDSFTVSDRFDVFHYSNWIRENAARASQRFFFTLTGATDSTTDIELPASSIFARKRSGDPTYLQVTIPSFNYATQIALRPSGEMLVDMGYEIDGEIGLRERILEADLEDISTYEGSVNRSVVLTGHRTQNFGGQVVTFNRSAVIYRGYQTRARAFRFAFIDPFLNPGDTVVVGAESFTANNIIYTINALRTTMEIREAL